MSATMIPRKVYKVPGASCLLSVQRAIPSTRVLLSTRVNYRAYTRTMATKREIAEPLKITLPNGLSYNQPTGIFIGNEFYKTEKTIKVENPSTGENVAEVYAASAEDVDFAVETAEKAFNSSWSLGDPSVRAKYLFKLADLIEEEQELIASIESFDNGKTLALARGDVGLVIQYFRSAAGSADKVDGRSIYTGTDYTNFTIREPIGVCGQIIPWNFPLLMLSWKIGPALATGNVVILKPASATPLNALYFASLVKRAGFPAGTVNIVPGPGRTCGEAILNHPRIRKIAFTGSTAIGRDVMLKAATSNLKKVSLELGGKSANIVFDDVDIKKTIPNLVAGIFKNAGQICSSGSRIYVQDTIYEELLKEFKIFIETQIKVGSPFDESNYQGAITNKQQFETILKYIDIGKSEGAKLLTGGHRVGDKGYFIEPTIFYDVDEDFRIVKEEIFGPVVTVSKFTTIEDVAAKANNSEYGLGGGIQTNNLNRALKTARLINTGTVWVNTFNDFDCHVPFGGVKQSGFGREMGEEAFDNYTQVKAIRIKLENITR